MNTALIILALLAVILVSIWLISYQVPEIIAYAVFIAVMMVGCIWDVRPWKGD